MNHCFFPRLHFFGAQKGPRRICTSAAGAVTRVQSSEHGSQPLWFLNSNTRQRVTRAEKPKIFHPWAAAHEQCSSVSLKRDISATQKATVGKGHPDSRVRAVAAQRLIVPSPVGVALRLRDRDHH